jgi:hypothetical protein
MSGGDELPVTSTFHRFVCKIIREKLNEFTTNPGDFIARESQLQSAPNLAEYPPSKAIVLVIGKTTTKE